ncbi:hypothetical protein [uncultured Roseibium sp.]|uniref:hypothetical protein n=1 Tax=uncultured Roseibium sp. TaxID=1936171 RepID=UPI0026253476|nr:hypothetical protein [uncultured Roseibium sp.]
MKDMPIPEALEQAAIREHNQIYLLYLMNFLRGHDDGMAVELGAPMEDLSDAEHSYRETLFAGECSSAVRFYDDKRFQLNTSAVYSDAAPGSYEQIECLKFQTLIFLRPASVPFRSIAPEQ